MAALLGIHVPLEAQRASIAIASGALPLAENLGL